MLQLMPRPKHQQHSLQVVVVVMMVQMIILTWMISAPDVPQIIWSLIQIANNDISNVVRQEIVCKVVAQAYFLTPIN
jgi:hypothetical protein